MARRERHHVELADIPGADDVAARIGIALQAFDDSCDLVDVAAVRRWPRAPLSSVDRSEVSVRSSPLVPNRHAMLVEVTHIVRTLQEPEQLVDDRFDVHLLTSDERKAFGKIETHLVDEDAERAGIGPVVLADAGLANAGEEIEILTHG